MTQTDQPCSLCVYRNPQESTGFSPFQLLYRRSVTGLGTILKELWTKEVIPEVKTSLEYVKDFHERLEDSLKMAIKKYRSLRNDTRNIMTRRLNLGDRRPNTDIAPDREYLNASY